ncbi:MAG: GDYXXLXY domain-containing protein [Gammaproteobacteria bacterium]|nr:GDYXXLXY domain-containing protein [Gammaproteobacteria bacterium]
MTLIRNNLIIALVIPIIALAGLVAHKVYKINVGQEYILPILGFDPRDLLSGHYLIYRIDYGVSGLCSGMKYNQEKPAYVCLSPRSFSELKPQHCTAMISGHCRGSRFNAGIERFFVPQADARTLERAVRGRKGSIVLAVNRSGKALIKDLLIEDQPWRDYLSTLEQIESKQ